MPWWVDPAKDLAIVLLCAISMFLLLALLSVPNIEAIERAKTQVAEQRVQALQTQIARFPTPMPCRHIIGMGPDC